MPPRINFHRGCHQSGIWWTIDSVDREGIVCHLALRSLNFVDAESSVTVSPSK